MFVFAQRNDTLNGLVEQQMKHWGYKYFRTNLKYYVFIDWKSMGRHYRFINRLSEIRSFYGLDYLLNGSYFSIQKLKNWLNRSGKKACLHSFHGIEFYTFILFNSLKCVKHLSLFFRNIDEKSAWNAILRVRYSSKISIYQ